MKNKVVVTATVVALVTSAVLNLAQQEQKNKLKSKIVYLNHEIDNLEFEKTTLQNRVDELEESKENLQQSIEQTQGDVDELKGQLEYEYHDKWDLEQKVKDLGDEVDEMHQNNEDN
ncbi:hypothetical protein QEG73_01010 [Chitinophagaceae bacterium 26-R-25]|nr:hypothetical protein [Chitinophagaceae bacterium 26-R-25]